MLSGNIDQPVIDQPELQKMRFEPAHHHLPSHQQLKHSIIQLQKQKLGLQSPHSLAFKKQYIPNLKFLERKPADILLP